MLSIDEVLGELPMPPYVTAEDVGFAVRALTVHAAEQWPDGPRCRNDRAPHRAGCTAGAAGSSTSAASPTRRSAR
ncbi:hypothetical protein [Micromonospora deserti]|uniref:hypothetical protein n=1 Tax=Micromonospora deserti TaxID=2070366 RepID=UPI001F4521D4|nr:hypothetical protein [Micromonospora deserti]